MNNSKAREVAVDLLIACAVRSERQESPEMKKKTVSPWKLRALSVAEVSKGETDPFRLLCRMMGLDADEAARVTTGIHGGSKARVMEKRLARLALGIVGKAMAAADAEIYGAGYFPNSARDEALEYTSQGV